MSRILLVAVLVSLSLCQGASAGVAINGGLSWEGWTSKGQSNQLGVYGSGETANVYEIYTTLFEFNNNEVTGGAIGGGPTGGTSGFGTGAYSNGAFANGNTILGIGVRRISGDVFYKPTVRFDLDNDSYQAASSVGGIDGKTRFSEWSEKGDFSLQFEGNQAWRGGSLTMQAGNGTSNGGSDNQQSLQGGYGSGVSYDWAFRAFAQTNSYQMFFDLTRMPTLYGNNPFGLNSNFTGIGPIGNPIRISLTGIGEQNPTGSGATTVVFSVPTKNTEVVPEPTSLSIFGIAAACGLGAYRRRKGRSL